MFVAILGSFFEVEGKLFAFINVLFIPVRWDIKKYVRKKATNIRAESIGLQPNSDAYPNRIMIVKHLTPKIQTLFSEAKQIQPNYKFCWVKNSVIFLRKTEDSNHIQIHCLQDRENLAD